MDSGATHAVWADASRQRDKIVARMRM